MVGHFFEGNLGGAHLETRPNQQRHFFKGNLGGACFEAHPHQQTNTPRRTTGLTAPSQSALAPLLHVARVRGKFKARKLGGVEVEVLPHGDVRRIAIGLLGSFWFNQLLVLWMDEILRQIETMGSHFLSVFTGE